MTAIDFLSVDHAEICKYTKPIIDSTMGADHRQLNSEQIRSFVDEWNKATYIGVCNLNQYIVSTYI
ncbi:MAG: hypothetical protein IPL10_06515 [Bacteroidetes bacterium]|nr:hypothetical protein [Bacteroidota bacterium]